MPLGWQALRQPPCNNVPITQLDLLDHLLENFKIKHFMSLSLKLETCIQVKLWAEIQYVNRESWCSKWSKICETRDLWPPHLGPSVTQGSSENSLNTSNVALPPVL